MLILDALTERAIRVFLQRLEGRYPVEEAILFGSRARQTHGPESDADLVVVLQGEKGDRSAISQDMAGIAFDVLLDTDVLVQAWPLWRSDFGDEKLCASPLMRGLRRDGLTVHRGS